MTTKDKIAGEIGGELKGVGYNFDPTIIITIITTLIGMFQNCNLSPAQAERRAAKPKLLDKLTLRRTIRQYATDNDQAESLHAAFLDKGAELTQADFQNLYANK